MLKNSMDPSSTYLFEVHFREIPALGEAQGSPARNRAIIVEVEPESVVETAKYLPPSEGETARQYAKELAPQFAMQVIQKDLPHGFEPPYSVMEIEQLPNHLHLRSPKLQGNWFRAWLLEL
jgi:hypothetical protein